MLKIFLFLLGLVVFGNFDKARALGGTFVQNCFTFGPMVYEEMSFKEKV